MHASVNICLNMEAVGLAHRGATHAIVNEIKLL